MVQVSQPFRPDQEHGENKEKNIADTIIAVGVVRFETLLDCTMNSIQSKKMVDQG
jgi:hypothetical protein